jgi:hypothetical protein
VPRKARNDTDLIDEDLALWKKYDKVARSDLSSLEKQGKVARSVLSSLEKHGGDENVIWSVRRKHGDYASFGCGKSVRSQRKRFFQNS